MNVVGMVVEGRICVERIIIFENRYGEFRVKVIIRRSSLTWYCALQINQRTQQPQSPTPAQPSEMVEDDNNNEQ